MEENSTQNHIPVGRIIAEARLRQSLSQEDLAERVGMSQEWVTKIETGRIRQPKLHSLRRVADVLNLDFETLVIAAGYASESSGATKIVSATPEPDPLDDPALRASFSHIPDLTDENLDKVATLVEDLFRLQELGQVQNTKAGARRKRGA